MNIESLKYFHAVANIGSISRVASNSHISQPALSQQIQKLEEVLGYKLLNRSNKGVALTEAGRIVQKYSKTLIKSYDNMLEDLTVIDTTNNTVRIDSSPTIATYSLPCTIYTMKEEYPGYKICLSTNLSEEVEHSVINEVSDFGFIHGMPYESSLQAARVGVDRLVVVASQGITIDNEVVLKDLLNYQLILLLDRFKVTQEIRSHFQKSDYDLNDFNILLSLDSIESIKSTVIKGYGISILPYVSVKKELYSQQLKEVKVKELDMNYEIYLVYKQDKEIRRCVKNCISFFKKIGEKSFC
ncbi:MAG: LysR family transcriptional regulator [Firmicutes bacterium HGW-Firmicutes-12]|jgi:DNA-binding transcriptional LysR family regulator|nr:MAG: LysR family transcriptional regulator [Firmicutes bacterium HGW-Firmicutes-12]